MTPLSFLPERTGLGFMDLLSEPDRHQPSNRNISCQNRIGTSPRTGHILSEPDRRPASPIHCARWRIKRAGGQRGRFASSDPPIAAQSVHHLSEDFRRLCKPLMTIRYDLLITLDLARRR